MGRNLHPALPGLTSTSQPSSPNPAITRLSSTDGIAVPYLGSRLSGRISFFSVFFAGALSGVWLVSSAGIARPTAIEVPTTRARAAIHDLARIAVRLLCLCSIDTEPLRLTGEWLPEK